MSKIRSSQPSYRSNRGPAAINCPQTSVKISQSPRWSVTRLQDLTASKTESDSIVQRATSLFGDVGTAEYGQKVEEPFRTAVFVRYRNDARRDLLEALEIPEPEEDHGDIETRPERIWKYLSQTADDETGLQPETLVRLGHIDELHFERIHGGNGGVETADYWEIDRERSGSVTHDELTDEYVRVAVHQGSDSNPIAVRGFDQFPFDDSGDFKTKLLVDNVPENQDHEPTPIQSYPLYLFYPIQNTSNNPFPFCLHGRFRVETNCKDLSRNNTDHI